MSPPVFSLCSPVGRGSCRTAAAAWAGRDLLGAGSESPLAVPDSGALACHCGGKTDADPVDPVLPLSPSTCRLWDSPTVCIRPLFSKCWEAWWLRVAASKDLGSNPSSASSRLCDLGHLNLSVPLCIGGGEDRTTLIGLLQTHSARSQ